MKRKNNSIIYYLFWTCVIFLGSILGLFAISKLIPESLLYSLRGNRFNIQSKEKIKEPPPIQTYSEQDNKVAKIIPEEPQDNMSQDIMTLGVPSPIFVEGELTPTGYFTNYRGTVFVAGTLYFTGTYPQDFEQPHSRPTSKVQVTLAFGWRDLPNFAELNRKYKDTQESTVRITLPPLSILDLQITITDMPHSGSASEIRRDISEYIQLLFNRQLISEEIIHLAHQRLASAYIAESYHSIELIPY